MLISLKENQLVIKDRMASMVEIFAERLKTLREQSGLTQSVLAARAQMSRGGIQSLESAERWPESDTVSRLASALGVQEIRLFIPGDYRPEPSVHEALAVINDSLGYQPPKLKKKPRSQESKKPKKDKPSR